MNQIGKYGRMWAATRRQWFKENAPNFQAYYFCYICGTPMTKRETTLDHKLTRGKHPELRFNLDNLFPCCEPCNLDKGSRDYDEYMLALNKT